MPANRIGKNFEREVVADIRHAFAFLNLTRADCFRTPMSGGHHALPGVDIQMSPKLFPHFPYAVECKSTKTFHVGAMMKPRASEQEWGAQVLKAAKDIEGSIPLLVMKDKFVGVFAALPMQFSRGHGFDPDYCLQFRLCGYRWIMFHWNEWLEYKADQAQRVAMRLRGKGKK